MCANPQQKILNSVVVGAFNFNFSEKKPWFLENDRALSKFLYGVSPYIISIIHELLFRHIFETQIHIQTQIRKSFILALATNDLL